MVYYLVGGKKRYTTQEAALEAANRIFRETGVIVAVELYVKESNI